MIFNVEPAIYIEPASGRRHCDLVVVTEKGCETLTPFQKKLEELFIKTNSAAESIAA